MVADNFIGMRFGMLVASKRVASGKHGHAIWECKCDCGNVVDIRAENLKRGKKDCGCVLEKARKNGINQGYLKTIMHYCPDTGEFSWLKNNNSNSIKIGDKVGFVKKTRTGNIYMSTSIHQSEYLLHRLAWLYITGEFPKNNIDHINGCGTDNRFINLRDVDQSENNRNKKLFVTNSSGISGVVWVRRINKWFAGIHVNSKQKSLGYFDNIFDAACARKIAESLHGYHVNHGKLRER